ncbi:MAG: hypothetical protein GC181_04960 [Bacteroidetes bacterium]|nr:hypothetical protein [Bacteroidota bacterium]
MQRFTRFLIAFWYLALPGIDLVHHIQETEHFVQCEVNGTHICSNIYEHPDCDLCTLQHRPFTASSGAIFSNPFLEAIELAGVEVISPEKAYVLNYSNRGPPVFS